MDLRQEKTIKFDNVRSICKTLNSVLNSLKPDRWTAICAMIELAIATLKPHEALKHDLEAVYKKHVKQASGIIMPPGILS